MLICGRRGSGKTTLCCRLIASPSAFKGKFDKVVLLSPTAYLSPQWRCFDMQKWDVHVTYSKDVITDLIEQQTNYWSLFGRERPKVLLILDDMSQSARRSVKASEVDPLATLASNGRHLDISIIMMGQQFTQCCPALRSNADVIVAYASHNLRDNVALYNSACPQ